ncbi:MAG: hypothetical protein AB7N76_31940 [Planctomycetota bacterium]
MSAATPETLTNDPILDATWGEDPFEASPEATPRYAAQRAKAARLSNLPRRMLLNRARLVGDALRRMEESAEHDGLQR